MLRTRAVAATVVLLALLGGACGSSKPPTEQATGAGTAVKIGVVGPMTGLAAFVGKNMVEGIQLAIDDINERGGVNGHPVQFVVRDDEADPAKTSTAVRELIEKEHVAALFGPAGSTNYLSIARLLRDDHVPAWVISAGSELSQNVNPYAFRAYIPDRLEVGALAEFASKRYSKIAVLTSNDAEGTEFAKETTTSLARFGRTPVAIATFALDETDYSPLALKVKRAGAQAVIMGTHLGLFASRFATAIRNLGSSAQMLGPAGLINYTYPDLARAAGDGTVIVSFRSWGHLPKDQWPGSVRTFYEAYVKRYLPEGEFSQTGAYKAYSTNFLTYDMVKIWAAAAERAKSADPQKVTDVLNGGFTYAADKSVIGVPWKYSSDNHDGIEPGDLSFYRWEYGSNQKFKLHFLGSVSDVLSGRVRV